MSPEQKNFPKSLEELEKLSLEEVQRRLAELSCEKFHNKRHYKRCNEIIKDSVVGPGSDPEILDIVVGLPR